MKRMFMSPVRLRHSRSGGDLSRTGVASSQASASDSPEEFNLDVHPLVGVTELEWFDSVRASPEELRLSPCFGEGLEAHEQRQRSFVIFVIS